MDGVDGFRELAGSILFLDPNAAQTVDEDYASNTLKKETWGDREDVLSSPASPGVLNTLARATRAAMKGQPTHQPGCAHGGCPGLPRQVGRYIHGRATRSNVPVRG